MPVVVAGIVQHVHMGKAEDADDKEPEHGDEAELGGARARRYGAE